jgi:hypothetical protein
MLKMLDLSHDELGCIVVHGRRRLSLIPNVQYLRRLEGDLLRGDPLILGGNGSNSIEYVETHYLLLDLSQQLLC